MTLFVDLTDEEKQPFTSMLIPAKGKSAAQVKITFNPRSGIIPADAKAEILVRVDGHEQIVPENDKFIVSSTNPVVTIDLERIPSQSVAVVLSEKGQIRGGVKYGVQHRVPQTA